jgi:excisionase family DNA binding protein
VVKYCHTKKRRAAMIAMEEMLTTEDVARILRISEYTARGLCRNGEIKARKVGRNYRVKQEDLRAYIDNPPGTGQDKK